MILKSIQRLFSQVNASSSVFQSKFPGNLPQATLTALAYITKLPKNQLITSLDIFRVNVHRSRNTIPAQISAVLKSEPLNQSLNTEYEELFKSLTHAHTYISFANSIELTANGINEALKVIYEFCDKGKIGFLSGDFSYELFEVLLNHISHIETESLEDNKEAYSKIEEYIAEQEFCLPKHGIPSPGKENPQAMFIRELTIERDSPEIVMNKIKNDMDLLTHSAFGLNYLSPKEHLIKLFTHFCRRIRHEQELCLKKELSPARRKYADLLIKCSADKLAILTLTSLLQASAPEVKDVDNEVVLKFSLIIESIAKNVEKQITEDKSDALLDDFIKKRKFEKKAPIKDENLLRKLLSRQLKEIKKDVRSNSDGVFELAGVLLQALMESSQMKDKNDKIQSALKHEIIADPNAKAKKLGILKISKEFIKILMGKTASKRKDLNYIYLERTLPMIYPPARWVDWETGGYLQKGFAIMRLQGSRLQRTSLERADLSRVCEVLNIMGDTPWRINKRVLEVVESLYFLGGGVGEIPIVDKGSYFVPKTEMTYFQKQKLQKDKKDNWSLLSDFEIKLGIARRFKEVERFYMPLNVDFRGRIYPISPHLNQIGNDTSRGLLEFAEAKPLGKSGLEWLKIHMANKMGFDKLRINERIEIVEKLLPDLKDMAKDPVKHRQWLEYEDPWQSLATLFDLVSALESPDPEKYKSHLHIHQDGSCNGLQHYAALGRDIEGATQVNLVDRDKPGDLYTAVSEKVQQIVDQDAANGKKLAEKLKGQIKRKIVKQTVMTSVYGVTFIGAKDQILKQLRERSNLTEEDLVPASVYLAKITMTVLENFFEGAQRIKEWLIDCAGLIAKKGYPVCWITPLGLPVVQPYRRGHSTMFIDTFFQRVSLISNKDSLPISVPKQKSAFPPNFVHSLDSTHLMLTAVQCHKVGIEFAAVHDSFWTHACDIDQMNTLLREQFVNLHSQPLLDNLLEGFKSQFPTIKFKDIPQRGKFDLSGVINSKYFFA